MSEYTYLSIVKAAKECKSNVEKSYKLGVTAKWAYYFAKAIVNPKRNIKKLSFDNAPNPSGTNISRQIVKSDYTDMAKRLIKYVETNKQLPNYITYKSYKLRTRVYVYMLAKIVVYYNTHNQMPNYVSISSKAFTKPVETGNAVYDYWVKKIGTKPKSIDDVCDYILKYFNYEFYFDDHKTNKQVIDSKAGNCTDLSQMLSNMAEALGYEWKCIHTQCRQSGTGHVYLKLRKGGNWFTRDVACIADESKYCVWCDVDNAKGYKLAENPLWWMANRNR